MLDCPAVVVEDSVEGDVEKDSAVGVVVFVLVVVFSPPRSTKTLAEIRTLTMTTAAATMR